MIALFLSVGIFSWLVFDLFFSKKEEFYCQGDCNQGRQCKCLKARK